MPSNYNHFYSSILSLVGMSLSASIAPLMYLQAVVVDKPLFVLSAAEPGLVHGMEHLISQSHS
jgi:hypothetical protein